MEFVDREGDVEDVNIWVAVSNGDGYGEANVG
jgi:hypothetical protein